jgi:hypothetical protein
LQELDVVPIDPDTKIATIGHDLKDRDDSPLHSVSIWLDRGEEARVW